MESTLCAHMFKSVGCYATDLLVHVNGLAYDGLTDLVFSLQYCEPDPNLLSALHSILLFAVICIRWRKMTPIIVIPDPHKYRCYGTVLLHNVKRSLPPFVYVSAN